MKKKDDDNASTSVSFLDVIACAFGAIVLLVLILPIEQAVLAEAEPVNVDYGQLVLASQTLDEQIDALARQIENNQALLQQLNSESSSKDSRATNLRKAITTTTAELNRLRGSTQSTEATRQLMLQRIDRQPSVTDAEFAGIPVDSEYVAFVIDTSGSMRSIWLQVRDEVNNVLNIYPQMQGFHVLSDQGVYLYESYKNRWIPDTPQFRRRAMTKLANWRAPSNSSPTNGIRTALQDLYDPNKKIALFIFGDDFSGSEVLDEYVREIDGIVLGAGVMQGSLRIHAIGFENNPSTVFSSLRFAALMRELTYRHGGAFLALPRNELQVVSSGS